tara:strand:+ start:285 stop:782 length:498 start_codon:yes stop_codon:yes gene_type:complete
MQKIMIVFATIMFIFNFLVFDHYLENAWNKVFEYQEQVFALEDKIRQYENSEPLVTTFEVTATMYRPTVYETDSSPNITADGTKINISKAGSYRYIALSRNLLSRWGGPFNYGDYIVVKGTKGGKHDGIWQVRDTMNPRFIDRIDFLCDPDAKPFKYDNVVITKI